MSMNPPKPEAKLPPRVWLSHPSKIKMQPATAHETWRWAAFSKPFGKADGRVLGETEYLSLREAESLCQERERKARREAWEAAANFVADYLPKPFTDQLVYNAMMEKAQSEEAPNEQ